ncbi:hypothetical protein CVT24_006141 [Panaeolus cyanescens]|uniref:DUF7330 domain-containing protein n=1 Tax=Panaeolus cyanescens TaxID=181874 RepID=A0A409WHI9_9AGAR|nr:hypothetical protein CVT24_006141 [Panaeolus cyanescens]
MVIDKSVSVAAPSHLTDDAPPSYTMTASSSSSPSASGDYTTMGTRQPPIGVESANFVQIIRTEDSVRGTWVIDPNLVIPAAFLPPLPAGLDSSQRMNLHLESKEGCVQGEVYIKPISHEIRSTMKRTSKILIYAMAKEDKVELRIHDTPILHPGDQRLPIHLKAKSKEDNVRIYLPRSFCGPFHISTKSSDRSTVVLSPAIRERLCTMSQNLKIRQGFIGRPGHPTQLEGSLDNWDGDMLEIEILDSWSDVKLYFDDEDTKGTQKGGTLRKLFGL